MGVEENSLGEMMQRRKDKEKSMEGYKQNKKRTTEWEKRNKKKYRNGIYESVSSSPVQL